MKIVEIFDSIDGEGIRTGRLVSFVRTAGCNLRCSYCDTEYALFGEKEQCEYTEMSVDDIIQKLNHKWKRVTVTGGEPLLADGIHLLVSKLLKQGFEVNIETNGAVDIRKFISKIDTTEGMFFTIDYKLPSSKMTNKMIWDNFLSLGHDDVIKFVIGSDEDFDETLRVIERIKGSYNVMPHIYLGAVYGMYDAAVLIEKMMKSDLLKDAVFQTQLHKVVWAPDKRGV